MSHTQMRDDFYYVVLKGRRGIRWLADERVKKGFLNQLLVIRSKVSFQVYAFCILDKEAHFLLSIPHGISIERTTGKMSHELMKSYRRQYPYGKEDAFATIEGLPECSHAAVLERCCQIHLLAKEYAERIQDYWWSSYVDYLNKNITGLIESERILQVLDADPQRALHKFIQYHKMYIPLINNVSEQKK